MIAPKNDNGRDEGKRRKLEAHRLLEAHRKVYLNRSRRALLLKLLEDGTATADAVRDAVELPPGIDPKLFGSVPGPLARAKIIERSDYVPSCRPAAHGRPVSVWQLVDHRAALDWLAEHPDDDPPAGAAVATDAMSASKQGGPDPTSAETERQRLLPLTL